MQAHTSPRGCRRWRNGGDVAVEPQSEGSTLLPSFAPLPCPHRNPQAVIPGAQELPRFQRGSFWKEGEGPLCHCPSAQLGLLQILQPATLPYFLFCFFVLKCTENVTLGEDWNGWEEISAVSTELLLNTVGECSHLLPFPALPSLNRGNLELQYL